jgi:outer membrane receptor protein involved in Fe transport/Tfp pilus assembly protein PilF
MADASPLTMSLREVIAATTLQTNVPANSPPLNNAAATNSSSHLLGLSYYEQSRHHLDAALAAAQAAVTVSTNFGFGWERVAELEFSFGRVSEARDASRRALVLAPRNAQAHALDGFVLAARNQISDAITEFNAALAIDGGLGNAWLGRGLCRVKRAQAQAGLQDLQTAAALEPNRSLLRSYLGKAFLNVGAITNAMRELALAERLDPADPTSWLYQSLLDYQENWTIKSLDDLQTAEELNGNREVYRSKLLLDQDRAVSGTSLAKIYQDAGLNEYSVDEASRSVDYDYANYSAHLFLADSLNALRDPTRFNLRYETAWFNELLLANLLAPPGARPLSQNISQQEYSRLLEGDGAGFDMTTQYRSDRQLEDLSSQYGAWGRTSYSLDLDYQHNDGILNPYRPNNALSDIEWYSTIKQQVGPNDAATVIVKYENYHSGDNYQYNNPANANPTFQFNEYQTPIAVAAWHHESGPGIHTLFLAGRLTDDQSFYSEAAGIPVIQAANGKIENYGFSENVTNFNLTNSFVIYTAELNQLFQGDTHTWIPGARYQAGQFDTSDLVAGAQYAEYFPRPIPIETNAQTGFRRASAYAYHIWEIVPHLRLTAGVAYDSMTYPDNFRFVPISSGEAYRDQLSPKLALTWSPRPDISFRAAYAQALGGASFDESFTLEPTQLGGFNQAFRSVISESLVGSVAGPRYQILGAGMDAKLLPSTYLTLQAQDLQSDVSESVGVFDRNPTGNPPETPDYLPGTVGEQMRYREPSASLTLNQLLGNYVTAGAGYQYTRSTLGLSDAYLLNLAPDTVENADLEAQLHQVHAFVQLTHPCGFYARAEAQWYLQFNSGYTPGTFDPPLPRSEFAQVNLYAGWRFWRRRAEAMAGILNVGGGDYSLNPLNVYSELPRSRVWTVRVRFNF